MCTIVSFGILIREQCMVGKPAAPRSMRGKVGRGGCVQTARQPLGATPPHTHGSGGLFIHLLRPDSLAAVSDFTPGILLRPPHTVAPHNDSGYETMT